MAKKSPTALEKIVKRAKTRKVNLQKKLDELMSKAAKDMAINHLEHQRSKL